ncbi:MAG TPA: hypothetical protein VMD98_03305 [Bryocella sp.]|nr:hypothetical protein [Bryocella sp.]
MKMIVCSGMIRDGERVHGMVDENQAVHEDQISGRTADPIGGSSRSDANGASRPPEESHVEGAEYQDDTNIHCQPFPESVFEEHDIDNDYDGSHRRHVEHAD